MTKADALSRFKNASAMARALKISRSAVSQWPEHGDIPREHELTILYVLKPEDFGLDGEGESEPQVQAKAA